MPPRRGKATSQKFEKTLAVVKKLNDTELRKELLYYDVSAAITDTTRGLYEKKLTTYLTEDKPTQAPPPEEEEEEEDTEEEEEEEEEEQEEQEEEYSASESEEIQTPRITGKGDGGARRRAQAAETVNQEQQTSPRKTEVKGEEGSGVSIRTLLFILALVAVLLYVIWYYANGGNQGGGSTPKLTQNV